MGCDLLLVSGEHQSRQLQSLTFNWPASSDPDQSARASVPSHPVPPPPNPAARLDPRADPDHRARDQLLRQLNTWAQQRPHWTVMLQRDHSWTSARALMPSDTPADNLVEAAPGQLLPLLGSCDRLLTVSSPWSLAEGGLGPNSIVVGDYGIHDEQNTTGFFGCGAMDRLRSIPLDAITELPRANQAWLNSMGADIANGAERLIEALHAKAGREKMTAPPPDQR